MTEVRWERMFRDQLEERFAQCPVVFFTYGLCEPHGPHNAVGLDSLKAHGLAVAAAREHGGIVAPADYWHIHEVGSYAAWGEERIGEARTWLTSIPPWHFLKSVLYQIRAADNLGFKAAILLTGHYGNWKDLKTLAQIVQPDVAMRLCAIRDSEGNSPGFDGSSGDHAGKVETSLLWALEPGCVDMSRLPLAQESELRFGVGVDAVKSDRRHGERMAADVVQWLGEKARELLQEFEAVRPTARLRTFDQVEEVWNRAVRPRLASSPQPGAPQGGFTSTEGDPVGEPVKKAAPTSQWARNSMAHTPR